MGCPGDWLPDCDQAQLTRDTKDDIWKTTITVPAGFTPDNAPVGLEFVGRPYAEATLFRLAHAFEQATQHRSQPVGALQGHP